MHTEKAVVFDCEAETLIGVLCLPALGREVPARTGVLIVVGGPQYRVGSHRQFVLLARFLADNGIPCLRFDYRGMGDATGDERGFEGVEADIDAAIAAFIANCPGLSRVVLWGLCDGASAICFSLARNAHVAGAVLLNPWVRTQSGEARTMLKHYYLRRLFDKGFWAKLLRGGVNVRAALGEVKESASKVATAPAGMATVPARMLQGLQRSEVPVAVFLSGRDYVAREFEGLLDQVGEWRHLMTTPRFSIVRFARADHTFSDSVARLAVEAATLQWLRAEALVDWSDGGK